jgi:hypothetical protein
LSYSRCLTYLVVFFMAMMTGCAVSDKPAIDQTPLTLPAPPTPVYAGNCNEPSVLETWMQPVTFQQREFFNLMQSAGEKSHDELAADVERMAALRDQISALATPDCAVETQAAFLRVMTAVLDDLQAVVNGDSVDVAAIIAEHQADYSAAQAMLDVLFERLNTTYSTPSG